jgi:hypothetical protein
MASGEGFLVDFSIMHTSMEKKSLGPELRTYLVILGATALALGFSNDILSNYFKDAYQASPYQRGLIEFPRETPGVLCSLIVALLVGFSDIKLAILAQVLSVIGITALGLSTPSFSLMLMLIFVNSWASIC